MSTFLIASSGFILWTISIILMYYSKSYSGVNHIESATGYGTYLTIILITYLGYRGWIWLSNKKNVSFSLFGVIGAALFHIFIVSLVYTSLPEVTASPFLAGNSLSSLTLFVHIIKLLFYPAILVFIMRSFGYSFGTLMMKKWREIDMRIRVPGEITLGFFFFSILLLISALLGYFQLHGLIFILVLMGVISYRGIRETFHDITKRKVQVEYSGSVGFHGPTELRTFSTEFAFLFFTFLLAVSLINVIRPMPIGWDDLGVYMNFPKILATTHETLKGVGMYAWQIITATGFLFDFNASQAFYVNQLGGILAVTFLTSVLSYAFGNTGKKYLLSLPILFAVFYYAMPMTVFQQAKDMKLDPAYLAFAISSIGLLFYAWKNQEQKKDKLILIGLIGLIIGFTFSIKLTSLMMILGILGWLSYYYASFWGYVGFFFLFLAFFTKFQLWGMMNVPMPKDIPTVTTISIVLLISSLVGFGLDIRSMSEKKWLHRIQEWMIVCLVFLLGVGGATVPWIVKNLLEIGESGTTKITISNILGGVPEKNLYDYNLIYSKDEIQDREKRGSLAITASGKSENEDMGRYLGYEEGLNNYLKLPANLTFQKNQGGEFTDITYLFLALVPSMLLFVIGRKEYTFVAGAGSLLVFMLLYYFTKGMGAYFSGFFGQFTLIFENGNWKSIGYMFLILINLLIVALIHFGTKNTENNIKLRDISVFMGIYAFLFLIAAFGIVWYGILIYFGFFLIIGLAANRFLEYTSEDEMDKEKMGIHMTLAGILFMFIITYFIRSAFPHGWNNLRNAYYNEYKYNILSQEESIFAYRSDYLIPIATLNLLDPSKATDGLDKDMKSSNMKNFLSKTNLSDIPLDQLHAFIIGNRGVNDPILKADLRHLGQSLYERVLYPSGENANTGRIYRIGTFMTYLIHQNTTRYFDDSLVMSFRDYFYDPSPEITVGRMKKMGLKYLLVDLNAATIDRDPRHDLTTRFENLLKTMNAKNLKLISTDNFCLELALSERKKGKLTTDNEFLDIAGTNYESFRGTSTLGRNQKLAQCHMYIIKVINENRASEYPTIAQIAEEVVANKASQDTTKLQQILARHVGQSWFALFEILETPVETINPGIMTGTGADGTGSQSKTNFTN